MRTNKTAALFLLAVFALVLGSTAFAEDREDPQAAKTPTLRTELIKLKYLDVGTASNLLRAYQSPFGRVSLSGGGPNAMIVVSDTPEIVEKMLAVMKEYDVMPTELQFTVQIVQGAEAGAEKEDEALKNDPVIRELRSVLKYKSFTLLDGTVLRVIDGGRAEAKVGPKGEYSIQLRPNYIKDGAVETMQVEVELVRNEWINQTTVSSDKKEETRGPQRYSESLIKTTLTLKAGEKTVVGVSKSDGDKGLILILSGKTLK